jgi:hypothetical protein
MNTNNNAVTITGGGKITACVNGAIFTIDSTHPNYNKALDAVKAQDWNAFLDHVDISRKVKDFVLNSDVQIVDGIIVYKGEPVHNTLTKRVISFMQQDLPFKPLLNFLYNLMENPSYRAVNELYDFLDVGELPITEDGFFLAFKNVRADYKDIHSGTFDNSVGSICEMPRYKVDEDKDRTCSSGLHFCSINYLPHFSDSNGGHTMIVKINPKDVVSIPADYNNTKGRCSRYEVIGEYTENWREKLGRGENGFDNDLYSSDGGDYEDEDDTICCEKCGTDLTHPDDDLDSELCRSCVEEVDCDYKINGHETCDENHCVKEEETCEKPKCCGGNCHTNTNSQYGVKPNGDLYHNLRDAFGKFIKKNVD